MTLSTFFEALNAHDLDPRPRHNAALASAIEREAKHLPDNEKEKILAGMLPAYLQDVTQALDRGENFTQLCDLLHEFLRAFRGQANNAMTRLRPRTPGEKIERRRAEFYTYLFRGHELDALQLKLQPDEEIITVDFRTIRTSIRTITRQDLIDCSTPSSQSNSRWRENFVSEQEIREAEQTVADAARAASEPQYGYNTDFGPRGIRPR